MDCECDCNSSTAVGTQAVFALQQVAVGLDINTIGLPSITNGGFPITKGSGIAMFSSSSTQYYQVSFSIQGGAWFSNGAARCEMTFAQIGGSFNYYVDCRPFA
jgi:hypothetical protein